MVSGIHEFNYFCKHTTIIDELTVIRDFILIGEPIDERGPIVTDKYAAIHAEAPAFTEMSVEQEILVTGIKVVDLLAPYAKGGKIGKFIFCIHPTKLKYLQMIGCDLIEN